MRTDDVPRCRRCRSSCARTIVILCVELCRKLGVNHSAITVRRYTFRPEERGPRPERGQTWKTFIKNHASDIYACDFVTQRRAAFRVAYISVVIELGSRKIVHANVTATPKLAWLASSRSVVFVLSTLGRGFDSRQRRHLRAATPPWPRRLSLSASAFDRDDQRALYARGSARATAMAPRRSRCEAGPIAS